jgi:L-lactate dehydrogenase complex protein LldG
MSADHVESFRDAVERAATVHQTQATEFEETLDATIEQPAIGTPLPFEGVSLDATSVETDFTPSDLERATTGVAHATAGIAEYGTITVPSTAEGVELVSLYTPRHVAVVAASDIEPGVKAAYERLGDAAEAGQDTHVLATGPSATADMGALVEGVHGPHEVHVIVLEDR